MKKAMRFLVLMMAIVIFAMQTVPAFAQTEAAMEKPVEAPVPNRVDPVVPTVNSAEIKIEKPVSPVISKNSAEAPKAQISLPAPKPVDPAESTVNSVEIQIPTKEEEKPAKTSKTKATKKSSSKKTSSAKKTSVVKTPVSEPYVGEEVIILDEPIPLTGLPMMAEVPQTGDMSGVYAMMSLVSLCGIVLLMKKRIAE